MKACILPITALLLAVSSASLPGQTPAKTEPTKTEPTKPDDGSAAAKRLEYMKQSLEGYDMRLGPAFTEKLARVPDPLLRFTNPVSGLQDGAFFVWRDETGRPQVGAQAYLTKDDWWLHEFQSLAPVGLRVKYTGELMWRPTRAGAEVKPFPSASPVASSPVRRLVQMREMAEQFAASDEFEGRPRFDALRMLSKPLLRFGADGTKTLDGALFVHAHGTDPELMIVLEALRVEGEYRWHYSLAPMTGYALKVTLRGEPLWEVPWRQPPWDPAEPFLVRVHVRPQPAARGEGQPPPASRKLLDFFFR